MQGGAINDYPRKTDINWDFLTYKVVYSKLFCRKEGGVGINTDVIQVIMKFLIFWVTSSSFL